MVSLRSSNSNVETLESKPSLSKEEKSSSSWTEEDGLGGQERNEKARQCMKGKVRAKGTNQGDECSTRKAAEAR